MPVGSPQVRDCIIEAGKRYCESNPVAPSEFGWLLLAFLAIGLWVGLWLWIADKYFDMHPGVALGGSFGLPLLFGGLYLILLT